MTVNARIEMSVVDDYTKGCFYIPQYRKMFLPLTEKDMDKITIIRALINGYIDIKTAKEKL